MNMVMLMMINPIPKNLLRRNNMEEKTLEQLIEELKQNAYDRGYNQGYQDAINDKEAN